MPRPSVIPQIRESLEAWLEEREAEYCAMPISSRKPTLPYTPDRKINVSAVAKAIGLKQTQRKYLHAHNELVSLLDAFAEGQGILPVGSRLANLSDKVVEQRIAWQASQARQGAQAATEANARVLAMMEELAAAHARIAELESELMRRKAREEMLHAGLMITVKG